MTSGNIFFKTGLRRNNPEYNKNKDEPFKNVLNVPLQLSSDSFENIENNMEEENIYKTSSDNIVQNNSYNPSYNEFDSFRNDILKLISQETKLGNLVIICGTNTTSLENDSKDYNVFLQVIKMLMKTKYKTVKINETNRIQNPIFDAPINYSDFKRDIEEERKNIPSNPDYGFFECDVNDELKENLLDSLIWNDSFDINQQNDNNKNNILFLDEGSPLFNEEEKNRSRKCDNIFEIFGNNFPQGENKNTIHETKECSNCIFTTQKLGKNIKSGEKKMNLLHSQNN